MVLMPGEQMNVCRLYRCNRLVFKSGGFYLFLVKDPEKPLAMQ